MVVGIVLVSTWYFLMFVVHTHTHTHTGTYTYTWVHTHTQRYVHIHTVHVHTHRYIHSVSMWYCLDISYLSDETRLQFILDAINEAAATCGWLMETAADNLRKHSLVGATSDVTSYTGADYETADTVSLTP